MTQLTTAHSDRPTAASRQAPQIAIRLATLRDLSRLTTLFDDYRVFYGRESNLRRAATFLADRLTRGESVVLVGTLRLPGGGGEEVVGFAQLYRTFSSVSLGTVIVLNDLYVAPAARRLGIGGRLVDAATAHAERVGALRLELEARPDNAPALRLYEARGFVAETEYTRLSRPVASRA